MKTKIYALLFFYAGLLLSDSVSAQSLCGTRYVDQVFSQVSIKTVPYDVWDSAMDIYQPVGDTSHTRPLIVLAHEGTFDAENKTEDLTVDTLCMRFAERGYVTASINYRLLTEIELGTDIFNNDTAAIITEVIQALSDGKAAIRFFSQDAATVDSFRVDTNRMFIGGNSAGAVLAMHYGFIDSVGQTAPYLQTIINANGGITGNSGNPGYSDKVLAVISLAGGLNNPDWIIPGDVAVFHAQGNEDPIVPFDCGYPENGAILLRLCGLGALQPVYAANNLNYSTQVFPGQGHVPWDTSVTMFNEVDSALAVFLAPLVCLAPSGINNVEASAEINLFPNPASNLVNIYSSLPVSSMNIYDETGREVSFTANLNSLTYQINTSNFSKGVYFVKFETGNNTAPLVKRLVIE